MFLDIIHHLVFCLKCRPVYISKHNVSETGFYQRPQVKPTLLGPKDRANPHLRTPVSLSSARAKNAFYIMTLHTYKALHQRCTSIEVIVGEKQYSLWCQPKKNKISTRTTLNGVLVYFCCNHGGPDVRDVQTGLADMSKLVWLIGRSSRDMRADSLYFLYVV
jgi:hypothetical protein